VNSSGQVSGTGSVCGGSGGGNVTGPSSSTQYEAPNFANTSGVVLGRSGILMNSGQATFGATLLSSPQQNTIPSYLASSNWCWPQWDATAVSGNYDNAINWGYNCAENTSDNYMRWSMENNYWDGTKHQNEYYM